MPVRGPVRSGRSSSLCALHPRDAIRRIDVSLRVAPCATCPRLATASRHRDTRAGYRMHPVRKGRHAQAASKKRAPGKRKASSAVAASADALSHSEHSGDDVEVESQQPPPPRTCTECRKSKVKCDLKMPCGRCKRMVLVCEPTPPSRRGRPGKVIIKRRRVDVVKPTKYEGIIVTSMTDDKDATKPAAAEPQVHKGLMFIVREWLAVGARRRSCEIVAKAFSLAAQSNLSMDEVLLAGDPNHAQPHVTSFLCPLMFSPYRSQAAQLDSVGPRVQAHEIPLDMLSELRISSFEDGWNIVHISQRGCKRFGLSDAFAKNVGTWDSLAEAYRRSNATDVTPNAWMERIHPKSEIPRVLENFGNMVKQYQRDPPPLKSFVCKVNRISGKTIEMEARTCLRLMGDDCMVALTSYSPIPKDESKSGHRFKDMHPAVPVPPATATASSSLAFQHAGMMAGPAASAAPPGGLRDIGELLETVQARDLPNPWTTSL
eukprot:m.103982 g.103982  ORF g.103982 m.103982 type:complete len:488 (+) comp10504_c1_seq2:1102-2565(+)